MLAYYQAKAGVSLKCFSFFSFPHPEKAILKISSWHMKVCGLSMFMPDKDKFNADDHL